MLATIEQVTGRPVPVTVGPRRAGDPDPAGRLRSNEPPQRLGWTPELTLTEMIADAWEFTGGARMNAASAAGLGAAELFRQTYSREPGRVFSAPGRVNLIGEHTDYTGGLVLPFAIDARANLAAARNDDNVVRVVSAQRPGTGAAAVGSSELDPGSPAADVGRVRVRCHLGAARGRPSTSAGSISRWTPRSRPAPGCPRRPPWNA